MSASMCLLALAITSVPVTRLDFPARPKPHVEFHVWPAVPKGASIRVEFTANCRGTVPAGVHKKIKLRRGKTVIKGRWVSEPRILRMSGSRVRLKFVPQQPLHPGTYTVTDVPELAKGDIADLLDEGKGKVTVSSAADTTPPKFRGLAGIGCKPLRQSTRRCTTSGILFRHGKATDASAVRYVLYVRKQGKPYDPTKPMEMDGIRSAVMASPRGPTYPWGKYIITLRARDAADNEGGRVCEARIETPVNSNCVGKAWHTRRRWRVRRKRRRFHWAKCARWDKRKRQWISAIDGVALGLPGR